MSDIVLDGSKDTGWNRRSHYAVVAGAPLTRVVRETARVAFADVRRLFDDLGRLLPFHLLPPDMGKAIKKFRVKQARNECCPHCGEKIDSEITDIEFNDKTTALSHLFRHHGGFQDSVKVDVNIAIDTAAAFFAEKHPELAREFYEYLQLSIGAGSQENVLEAVLLEDKEGE